MTGIERLYEVVRELGRFSFCYDLYETLGNIADQIERELRDERERWESDLAEAQVDWNRVAAACLDIKHFLDNHENAGVSDMEMWIRSLRDALKSDASDSAVQQNPSCADAVELAETIGWLEGFVGVVWLLPTDKVSDEMPAEYERRVERLRELVIGEVADSE